MTTIRRWFYSETERPEVREVRERVLLGLSVTVAALGIFPVILGVLTALEQGQVTYAILYSAIYVALVATIVGRKKLRYAARGGLLIALGIFFSFVVLLRLGLSGMGLELLVFFSVAGAVLYGARVGLRILVLCALGVAGVGAAMATDWIVVDSERLLTSYMVLPWINAVLLFVLMTVVLALAPQMLLVRLSQLVDEREADTRMLEAANERLRAEIAQRKQAETAQRHSEERFENFADILPEAVCEVDTRGHFTYVNPCGLGLFGYDREDLPSLTVRDIFEDRDNVDRQVQRILSGETIPLTEYVALRKDGAKFSVLVHIVPIHSGDSVVGMRGVAVDITELKRLEAELQQAQKMQAIGTLAGGLAHDFNNLLMGIQGRVSLMKAASSETSPHLGSIEEYIRSAAELTTRLLGFARGGALRGDADGAPKPGTRDDPVVRADAPGDRSAFPPVRRGVCRRGGRASDPAGLAQPVGQRLAGHARRR